MYNYAADLEFTFYDRVIVFNGSYYDGDSVCVPVYVDVPDDNLVEGTEKFEARLPGIFITVFIIDSDCKP